jgi:saccharopine dehydrogenase (NAD+, L-lysine-forming)
MITNIYTYLLILIFGDLIRYSRKEGEQVLYFAEIIYKMGKVLVIGAGGVGTVVAHKMASMPDVFSEIMLASRTKSKCDSIAAKIGKKHVSTAQVDADNVPQLVKLIRSFKPDLVVNVALPYQDLHIMDACLETQTSYLDTANYEPLEEAKFEYSWQWAYADRFKKAGITSILGL